MTGVVVTRLTPPGTGAIAVIEARGPWAWEVARQCFHPYGQPLPEQPTIHRFWVGTLAGDEVVLAATATDRVEIHCHGGHRIVQRIMDQFLNTCPHSSLASEMDDPNLCLYRLQQAPTLRTASILLDQWHGALAEELRRIRATLETNPEQTVSALKRLAEWGQRVGRHLVEPWQVVIAGPPNAGKSSLVNALIGYQRMVVSEVPGTTRDAVSIRTAFDGWPVELFDTAGLRDASGLEAAGIEQTRQRLQHADAIVWVTDATSSEALEPDLETVAAVPPLVGEWIWVRNKVDLLTASPPLGPAPSIDLSAKTGQNIAELIHAIVTRLVPAPPPPGGAVPYTPRLIEYISLADKALRENRHEQAKELLDEAYQLDQLSRTTARVLG